MQMKDLNCFQGGKSSTNVKDELQEFEGTRHHFMINDSISYKAGDLFIQNDLAKVLRSIAIRERAVFTKEKLQIK